MEGGSSSSQTVYVHQQLAMGSIVIYAMTTQRYLVFLTPALGPAVVVLAVWYFFEAYVGSWLGPDIELPWLNMSAGGKTGGSEFAGRILWGTSCCVLVLMCIAAIVGCCFVILNTVERGTKYRTAVPWVLLVTAVGAPALLS